MIKNYNTIIIGAGAAGLYCACMLANSGHEDVLVLERGKAAGRKLLMAGGGQCNLTHGGSIKEFLECYGEKGRMIRGTLQRHNNLELRSFFQNLGVKTYERDDGKVFPCSMDSKEVLIALLGKLRAVNIAINYNSEVTGIKPYADDSEKSFIVETKSEIKAETKADCFSCKNLVVATGGCSYPTTGSDGSMFKILARDCDLSVVEPAPALSAVFVENYKYGELTGISVKDVEVTVEHSGKKKLIRGDLLFAEQKLSGPVILNGARYMSPGDILRINYLFPMTVPELIARMKSEFSGNGKSPQSYMAEELKIPKRLAREFAEELEISNRKVSQLSGKDIKIMAEHLTENSLKISRLDSFSRAMATAGGIHLDEMNMKSMENKKYPGLYIIGEALDIDGDTGGYNLQFAYSSAASAADNILKNKI